ncbi:MAG: flagellin, partial [Clostridium sp.]|nr:flagellin [Clostridium sp.]
VINNASNAIDTLDKAISEVSSYRSRYGAIQNRMEETVRGVSSSNDTYERIYSGILDADLASEMMEVTRTSILMESSIALMAQSNKFPRDVLNILSGLIK